MVKFLKTNQLKLMLLLIMSTILAISMGIICLPNSNIQAETKDYNFTNIELKQSYTVGETVNIGEVKLEKGGEQIAAKVIFYFPDGSAKNVNSVVLKDIGNYTVNFVAQVDGKLYKEEKRFKTIRNYYSVSGAKSSVKFGVDESKYDTKKEGILLSLAQNESFDVNKIIDLRNFTKADNLIKMFLTPLTKGAYDARRFTVTLTDAYDPNIFVEIKVQCYPYEGSLWCYQSSYVAISFTGYQSTLNFGIPMMNSFYACGYRPVGQEFISLAYDYQTSTIYANGKSDNDKTPPQHLGRITDSEVYSTTFAGFTTGEVFLSIKGLDYQASTLNMVIVDLAKSKLDSTEVEYTSASKINIDLRGETQETIPDGVINHRYPIFDATVINGYSSDTKLETKVFYNYEYSTKYEINTKNGYFYPKKSGEYVIEYTAIDAFGNKAVKTIEVSILDNITALKLTANIAQLPKSGFVGEEIVIAEIGKQIVADQNNLGVGILEFERKMTLDNNEISVNESSFIPEKAGKYTVSFTVTDMVGQSDTQSYDIDITVSDKPVFTNKIVLPRYFMSKSSYILPKVTAYDYIKKKDIATTIKIIDEEGNITNLSGNTYKPDVLKDCEIKVIYVATNNNGVTESKPIIVPIKVVKIDRKINLVKYFSSQNTTITANKEYLAFSNNALQDVGSEFINPLFASSWSMKFSINSQKNNFSYVDIYLTDSVNAEQKIKLSVKKAQSAKNYTYLYINDTFAGGYLTHSFYDDGQILIAYDSYEKAIRFGDFSANIEKTCKGEKFNGFDSKKVYTNFVFREVIGASEIKLFKISTNSFSSDTIDYSAPNIEISGSNNVNYDINEEITVYSALACDALDSYTKITVSAFNEKNEVLTSQDGVKLINANCDRNYQIKLTEYGRYTVIYNYEDSTNNDKSSYFVYATDNLAPVITLSGDSVLHAKLGDTFLLNRATVTDNIDKNVSLYAIITYPSGKKQAFDKTEILLEQKGVYKIMFYAYDISGNYSVANQSIEVI